MTTTVSACKEGHKEDCDMLSNVGIPKSQKDETYCTCNPPTETDKTKQCFCQSIYNGETNTVDNCTCGKCADAIASHTKTVKNCKKCYEEKNYGICPHNHSTDPTVEKWEPSESQKKYWDSMKGKTGESSQTKNWENEFDKKFPLNDGWEFILKTALPKGLAVSNKEVKDFIRHSVQEAKAERDEYWKIKLMRSKISNKIFDDLLASLKQEESK